MSARHATMGAVTASSPLTAARTQADRCPGAAASASRGGRGPDPPPAARWRDHRDGVDAARGHRDGLRGRTGPAHLAGKPAAPRCPRRPRRRGDARTGRPHRRRRPAAVAHPRVGPQHRLLAAHRTRRRSRRPPTTAGPARRPTLWRPGTGSPARSLPLRPGRRPR